MNSEASNLETLTDTTGIGGHPRGLTTLFFTEMWERFSYYGMRALLILFMTTPVVSGGLGFSNDKAGPIYGAYTGSVYLMSLPGGWIADNVLGSRNAVFWGGCIIALGHFSMAISSLPTFYLGLVLIVLGTGLLKPNVSALVGGLYSPTDQRRDSGFSIFYMGINTGAFLAPLVCGYLGEKVNWHLGFGAAGVFMVLGLIQYKLSEDRLSHIGNAPDFPAAQIRRNGLIGAGLMLGIVAVVVTLYFGPEIIQKNRGYLMIGFLIAFLAWLFTSYLRPEEKKPVFVIVILFLFATIFWAVFEQAGSSFNLFARDFTDRSISSGWLLNSFRSLNLLSEKDNLFPGSWYQSVNSMYLIILAPVMSWLWLKLGNRQPSSPIKFSLSLFLVGAGAIVITLASLLLANASKVGPSWLMGVYLFHTLGELCLSPVGMSATTKLAPARLTGLMMGIWFLSISFGNFIGGETAGFFSGESADLLVGLFSKVAAVPIIAAIVLLALTPWIKNLMGKVR